MEPAQERRLVRAARDGDQRALRTLLEALSGPVYRFGQGFCRDRHDAEDVLQEVLVSLTRSLREFRGESSLATWAYTMARNACARQRRRGVHEPKRIESLHIHEEDGGRRGHAVAAGEAHEPERMFERRELRSAIERAIAALPRAQQEVLVLRDVEGLPASEAGLILGLGERAVKSRLHRARLALREALASFAPVPRRAVGRAAPGRGLSRRPRCPDTARLFSRHLDGELTADACARLQAHVADCPDCIRACEELKGALAACRRWRSAPLPAEVRRAVRGTVRHTAGAGADKR